MKSLSLTLFLFYLFSAAPAQTVQSKITVKGSVVDSVTGKPLVYVTVALQDMKTGTPVKSTLSKEDGSFEILAAADKAYQIVLTFTGYLNRTISVTGGGSKVNIGKIILSPSGKQLKEVTVTGVRPVIKREIDGISYDVTADPESVALNVLDMMRKVPLLSVDASDNIKLKGSGNYKILINGKESALVAKNPSDVLKAMPATNIEKIEVITTPPAKYDAEGLAGIINIITKKNIGQGYNVGINGRYNTVWGPGLNINGTLKQGKFGLSAFAGYNVHSKQTTGFGNTQTFFADNSVLSQNGANTYDGHHNYGDAELSYEIDSLNLLTGSIEIYRGSNDQSSNQFSNTLDGNNSIVQKYRLMNTGNSSFEGLDAAINYQLGFKKDKNRLLTLSYKYSYSPNKQFNSNAFSETLNYQQPGYQQYNNAGNKEHTVQLDYVHPFKKLTLEAGGKAIIRNNYSDFQTSNYNDTIKAYVINPFQTNDFNYKQDIYSLYNSYQLKWDKWIAKGGLRLEHTTIKADFVSVGSSVNQDYNNLIPSISIQRNFKSSSLNFGYTDRISRPGIYQLNPFVDQSNPRFISTGNPNLKPELNHSLELNYSNFAKSSVNIGLSYSFSKNAIQNVTSLQINNTINGSDTVTLTTYQNLGSNNRLGLNINTNFTIIKDLTVSVNGQAAHVWLKGTYNGQLYHNDGYTGEAFLNAGYKFGKGYRFGIDAGVFSGDVNLQGNSSTYIFTSYVISKTFLNKKATISLVSSNPYSKFFNFRSHTTTPDFYQSSFNQNPYRTFAIRFNFKFGKLNSDIKRNQRGINNDDAKPAKSSSGSQQ
ncbi:MAG: outer membrane beta-barrel family protein [Ginsengibacter sp.]